MSRKRKKKKGLWSDKVGPHGARVTVGERTRGGNVYLRSWDPRLGGQRKRSLKFKVRDVDGKLIPEAVEKAKAAAADLSNNLIKGERPGEHDRPLSLGELLDRFRRDVVDVGGGGARPWSDRHKAAVIRALELWETYLGRSFPVARFGPREWSALRRARETGQVDARGRRVDDPKKRRTRNPWTAATDLKVLRAACRYGTKVRRRDGSFLLDVDPTRGLDLPKNSDPKRPVADDKMLEDLLKAAGDMQVRHGTGKPDETAYRRAPLRELLILAGYTGRRIGAILGLRWSDWHPDNGQYGALTWRADTDKLGCESVVPVHPEVRAALEVWRRESPGIGDAPVFPAPNAAGETIRVDVALRWLRAAKEKTAGRPLPRSRFLP